MNGKGISAISDEEFLPLFKGKNFFFGIGINTYRKEFSSLLNARKDVEDVCRLLIEHYYFDEDNTQLLLDEAANRANIIDELTAFRKKISENDRLLIYYSGHGYLDKESELGYWIPSDAERDRYSSYLPNSEVLSILKATKAKHILLISDSCFSASLLTRAKTKDVNNAFKDWEQNTSRYVFISGKGIVFDGKKGENSPFAAGILKHLTQNNDEAINIARLADNVTKEVRFEYEQHAEAAPLFQSGHQGGQFVFWKRQTERDDWKKAQQINSEAAYLLFLEKHPKGVYTNQAEDALLHIADAKEWQNVCEKDAAFAYRAYLKKYPKGQFVAQANAKIEAIKQAEQVQQDRIVRAEQEQQAKQREAERIALLEQQVKAEREQKERAKIEQEIKEKEKQAREKAQQERLEQERILQEKEAHEKVEQSRLQQEKAERERKVKDNEMPLPSSIPLPTPPKANYTIPIAIVATLVIILLIWLWNRNPNPPTPTHASMTSVTTTGSPQQPSGQVSTSTQPKNKVGQNDANGNLTKKKEQNKSKPTVTDNPIIEPPKPSFDAAKVKGYLANAKSYCQGELWEKAKTALENAEKVTGLPDNVKIKIRAAKPYVDGELEIKAVIAIDEVMRSF